MCAGAIHTPHLLNLSGIGAAQQLREHDVPVAVDLPGVGQNLQVAMYQDCSLAPAEALS